jgi:transcriptional regulator with XRE-family HTH domain
MALTTRIRELMEARGLTQKRLAELAGVGPEQVSHWLAGRYVPSTASIRRLAQALEVSADTLFRESTEPEDAHAASVASVAKLARTLGVSPEEIQAAQHGEVAVVAWTDAERCMTIIAGARCVLRRHGFQVGHDFGAVPL